MAQDEGLFAKAGLHVTIKKIPSSKAVIAAQLNGQVDIGAGSYVGFIAAQAAGARFRILAEASTLRPDTRTLVVTAKSGITTIANLVGKKIGVNGTNSIGTLAVHDRSRAGNPGQVDDRPLRAGARARTPGRSVPDLSSRTGLQFRFGHLPEAVPLGFPANGLGQLGDELDRPRVLVRRD